MSAILSELIKEYIRKVTFLVDNHEKLDNSERKSLDKQLDSLENTITVMEGLK